MNKNTIIGAFLGLLAGVPASYLVQAEQLRAKVSFVNYFKHLPELVERYPGDVLPPLIVACAVLGIIGGVVGRASGRGSAGPSPE